MTAKLSEARKASAPEQAIKAAITAANGAIAFSQFVEYALYAPRHGYYMSPRCRFGAHGDFITAPGISSLFASAIAEQIARLLALLDSCTVIEVGAGDASLAAALIPQLKQRHPPFSSYRILERSPALQQRQRRRLAGLSPGVAIDWLNDRPEPRFCGVVLANEVLDAIPFDRFIVDNRNILPLGVGVRGDALCWQPLAKDAEFAAAVLAALAPRWAELEHGYVSEIAPWRDLWVARWQSCIERGALLLFDYGYAAPEYYHPDRRDGTLQCYCDHRMHADPFINIGRQDISAHVNFSALAAASDLQLLGYTTQANFLLASEVPQRLAALDPLSPQYIQSAGELKQLVMPFAMGDTVKVMLLGNGIAKDAKRARLLGADCNGLYL